VRVADYVVARLAEAGIGHVFTVCGGGSIFLNDALGRSKDMKYVACHHEQACTMAAEAYARVRNGLGCALVTSGPGGTNAITGVAGAWTDHVPTITISGQVFSTQTIQGRGLRTLGVQEINIVDIVKPITKYAVMVTDPQSIRMHLDHAIRTATHGRPGPVWLDIPADVQNAKIEPQRLETYCSSSQMESDLSTVPEVIRLLQTAKRPLVHVGQGVRLAGAEAEFFEFVERAGLPVLTARNANDIIDSGHELYIGRPGTFAQRGANFAVQSCDVYLAIGTRLSLAQTGYNAKDYARHAKVIMVDIDRAELDKGTVPIALKVQADAKEFLRELNRRAPEWPDWRGWLARCKALQEKYPPVTEAQRTQEKFCNSYHLVDELSNQLTKDDVVVTDMGFAFQNVHQAFRVKRGQRVFTNCGLASMGWGLPAAIGAAVGSGKRVVCVAGDGGLMDNAQELSTVKHHQLPVKLFVLNNGGYLTMRQSQANAFDRYMGSDEGSGLSFPHFRRLAEAHGIYSMRCEDSEMLHDVVAGALSTPGPVLCEIMMAPDQAQIPKSVNRREPDGTIKQTSLEDSWPYLPREEIEENLRV
jgi:acetolactate synthase-1/2/3 large subunit